MVDANNRDSGVTIEVSSITVEEITLRSTGANGKRARGRRVEGEKPKMSNSSQDRVVENSVYEDNDFISSKDYGEQSIHAVNVTGKQGTFEVAAKLRILCNVYPYRPHVVDPAFQLVPRLLGGFAGDFQPFLGHLARTSGTFTQPESFSDVEERSVQPQPSAAIRTPAATKTATPSIWHQMYDNKVLFISVIVGASAFLLIFLSAFIIIRRRTLTRNNCVDNEDDANGGDCDDCDIVEAIDGEEVYMTSKGRGYKHAISAPTPTNASWRQQMESASSTKSKKMFGVRSPKDIFPDGTDSEAYAMRQEQIREEQRRHDWEGQQIGGFVTGTRFNDNSSLQELVIKTNHSASTHSGGNDNDNDNDNGNGNGKGNLNGVCKASGKGQKKLLAAMKPTSLGRERCKQDPTGAVQCKQSPATPRTYVRLDVDPPDPPPSHPRHAATLQRKKMQRVK